MFLPCQLTIQCARFVMNNVDLASGDVIVGQLHRVIEIIVRPSDVQDVDKSGVRARDRFEGGHAVKLALKRTLTFERAPVNDLHRAQSAGERAGEPDLAIRAAPDHAQ